MLRGPPSFLRAVHLGLDEESARGRWWWDGDGVDGQMGMVAPLLGFPHLGFNTSVSSGAAKFELQTTLITLI